MKLTLLFGLFVLNALPAWAGIAYRCDAAANPPRGFLKAFSVRTDSIAMGSTVRHVDLATGQDRVLGVLTSKQFLLRYLTEHRPVFESTLKFLADKDVSGINPRDLARVTTIVGHHIKTDLQKDAVIYRLLVDKEQIGGSFVIDGRGTACLPPKN